MSDGGKVPLRTFESLVPTQTVGVIMGRNELKVALVGFFVTPHEMKSVIHSPSRGMRRPRCWRNPVRGKRSKDGVKRSLFVISLVCVALNDLDCLLATAG